MSLLYRCDGCRAEIVPEQLRPIYQADGIWLKTTAVRKDGDDAHLCHACLGLKLRAFADALAKPV